MSDDQTRQEFERWGARNGDLSVKAWEAWQSMWQAAYTAGRSAGLEEAAQLAKEEGDTPREEGGNISRWDACDNVRASILKRKEER